MKLFGVLSRRFVSRADLEKLSDRVAGLMDGGLVKMEEVVRLSLSRGTPFWLIV